MQSATVSMAFQLCQNLYYGCFSLFYGEEEDLENKKKFNALKVSRPEVAADTHGIVEETACKIFK
jgi:hypothetical protein